MERNRVIDLNADLGEGFGPWRMGDDDAMLQVVTSANVACGFHAGDPDIMAKTFALARENGVAVGAHVGFPDLAGFGRRPMAMTKAEIENAVAYQIGAAQALAALSGHRIRYVKAHGALANIAERDAGVADALARATRAVDASLTLLAIALSEQVHAGEGAGLNVAHEIFADRAYVDDGGLQPRGEAGAVITDGDAALARVNDMLAERALITITGKRLKTPIDSICVHGDTAHAVEMARRLRAGLEAQGFSLRAFIEGR
ncbi:LamB/YcsF family protein [Methylocystis parvus]|uniref:5-oxoprolinase subunit A n=1 Tax=Methylocystis parvus TaxID=134 RepID=A0A6B8LW55_9HYPH|nr:5-oxoprolinase subunit PxpA [Methylocystis parvus]QGM96647.1 LamB/YcsF family protein [Methylocystis parvus]WBJ99495.1 LamB/YcsF family protein [Methylocystis parvus OBBP]